MSWSAAIGAGGAILGGYLSSKGASKSGDQTATVQNKLDPRMDAMLFGSNGQGGLLDRYRALMDQPMDPRLQHFGSTNLNYLAGTGQDDLQAIRNKALGVLQGTTARTDLPAYAVGNMVQAPSQNRLDLSGSYNSLINGAPGANPFLMGAIQKGINQSTNAFGAMQQDATKNLMENVLPGIRSNSVLVGQYGGSRQGLAEGRALGDFGTAMQRAIGQFGQNNTDAAVAAQAGAYDADRNRQLAATQGLGAQQYGVAQQDAATKNAAEFMNVNNLYDAHKTNAQMDMQGAQLGAGLLGGLSSNAYGVGNNMNNYDLNRATQVNGLIAPYASANATTTTNNPLYTNKAGNMLGGAMMGSQLFGGMGSMFGGNSGNTGSLFDLFGKNSSFSGGGYF